MIHVVASIRLKPGTAADYLRVFKANVPNVKAERGCVQYAPAVDIDADLPAQALDGDLVTVIEKWETLDALRDHLAAPHMHALREEVKDMVEDVVLKVLQEA